MKKKIIVAGLTCIFLLLTGICYSCAYSSEASSVLVSAGTRDETELVVSDADLSEAISPTVKDIAENNSTTLKDNQADHNKEYIYAHICGAVMKPGVYRAESGARLYEFLNLAGGLTKKAAGDYINQAQPVTDGQRIYIPNQEEIEALSLEEVMAGDQKTSDSDNSSSGNTDTGSALININTAGAKELMSISGIGQAKANSILAYREKNGKFNNIEELMNIPGIKEGLFDQISYMIVAN